MAVFRLLLAICVCAAVLNAQDILDIQKYGLYNLVLYSNAFKCPFNDSRELYCSKIKIYLHNSMNDTVNTRYVNQSFADTTLNLNNLFIMYIPGFNNKNASNQVAVIENYKCLDKAYLLIADHSEYTVVSNPLLFFKAYDDAIKLYKCIGRELAKPLINLYNLGVDIDKFLVIGYSLGAQIAGEVAREFYAVTNVKLLIVVGCDPAGPCFDKAPKNQSLTLLDAINAIIWHCDAGQIATKFSYGTAAVFSNGGENQRGCYEPPIPEPFTSAQASLCSHIACPKVCTLPFCHPELWLAKLCDSKENYFSGACDGNSGALVSPLSRNLSGEYYFSTGNYSVT